MKDHVKIKDHVKMKDYVKMKDRVKMKDTMPKYLGSFLMVCTGSCILASALFGAMLLTTGVTTINAKEAKESFMSSFDDVQRSQYESIVTERRNLALQGTILGMLLGLLYFMTASTEGMERACNTTAIALGSVYFYYMLMPKSDAMVRYLNKGAQLDRYLEFGRSMSIKWDVGLLLGAAGCVVLGRAFK